MDSLSRNTGVRTAGLHYPRIGDLFIMESTQGFIVRARDEIVDACLVSQRDEGHDVAVRCEVPGRIKLIKRCLVCALRPIDPRGHRGGIDGNDGVATMSLRSMRSCHIPSAPAFAERSLIAHR